MTVFKSDRLPNWVVGLFIAAAVIGMPVTYSLGLLPRDSSRGSTILLWYFGALTAALGFSFLISGSTPHHHWVTGKVRRATSPKPFGWITTAYFILAGFLMTLAACRAL